MAAEIIILILALIFLMAGIFLFMGKCSWLIAGYNTASPKEKEAYDKKRICRAVSIVCFITVIMLCIMCYLGYRVDSGLMNESNMLPFAIIFIAVIILSVAACGIYINTKGKIK